MEYPSKIIAIQEKVKIGKYWLTFLCTDTGSCTVKFLAKLMGITPGTLLKRIEKYGAFNPLILNPEYLLNTKEWKVVGPTLLTGGKKSYTLRPQHVKTLETNAVKKELKRFKFRENCIRNKVECKQYSKCLGDRCDIMYGGFKGPWVKPGGESDCYEPIGRTMPIMSSYLGKTCGFKW